MSRPPVSHLAIVIPAMDEAVTLAECLRSVRAAVRDLRESSPRRYSVSVVVVLDSCTDSSALIAAQFDDVTTLTVNYSNVGKSRADGIRLALADLGSPRSATWIANTDADSRVPIDWLSAQLRLADSGADVLVGTVEPHFPDLSPRQAEAWAASHPTGRALGHVHGANLGVRASAYLRVGGFADQDEHEDVDLVERLRSIPIAVIASDAFAVTTSGRSIGRTPSGYAGYLRLLDQVVEPAG